MHRQFPQLYGLATSGQRLGIRYDLATNSVQFIEDGWASDVRGPATPRTAFREKLDSARIRRLPRRRAG